MRGSYAPWNLENICKSTNDLSFLCQFFINEITASDAGPDIIRSHLFSLTWRINVSTQFHRMSILSVNKMNIEVYYATSQSFQ